MAVKKYVDLLCFTRECVAAASGSGRRQRASERRRERPGRKNPGLEIASLEEPPVGFEPTTARLRIESSTTELRWRARNLAKPPAPCYRRSSSAFTVTVTVLALIASAAHAGLSRIPNDGYNTPAASGIAIRL